MRKLKPTFIIALFAAFVMSAATSASASAEVCHDGGVEPPEIAVLCINSEEHPGAETFSVSGGASQLVVTAGPEIECKEFSGNGEFTSTVDSENTSISDLSLEFKNSCIVKNSPEKCAVTQPIKVQGGKNLDGLDGTFKNVKEVEIVPSDAGEPFVTIQITSKVGTCPFAGSFNVTGAQVVEIKNASTEALEHEIVALQAGSTLKFGGKVAELKATGKVKFSGANAGKAGGIHTS
jgi:hypothetical protein